MRFSSTTPYIIVGLTRNGARFRPSDWAERLCGGVLSAFGAEKKMKYSRYVGPGHYNNEKAVVDGQLYEIEPMAYRFVLNFAQDNDLQLIEGVCPIAGAPRSA